MHAIHPRTRPVEHAHPDASGRFPWEAAHAAPEDRAVGLELELIELVARRNHIRDDEDLEAKALDTQIDAALAELGSVEAVSLAS